MTHARTNKNRTVSPTARTTCAVVASSNSSNSTKVNSESSCSLICKDTTNLSDLSLVENVFSSYSSNMCLLTEWKMNSVKPSSDNATQFVNFFDGKEICEDSKKLLCVSNAGGNSVFSEVLSFEFIKELFSKLNVTVSLFKTEMELEYVEGSKITDFALKLENNLTKESVFIGCSVTRCFNFLDLSAPVSRSSVKHLLTKKLEGVISSTSGCLNCTMTKQILHVWTSNSATAQLVKEVFESEISEQTKLNTIVLVTVAESGFECLFRERGDDALNARSMLNLTSMDASTSSELEV